MTPEEIARKIVGENIDGNIYHKAKIRLIAKALTEYGDLRAKEVLGSIGDTCSKHSEQARNLALEEAAEVVEGMFMGSAGELVEKLISGRILALKSGEK